MFKKSISVLAAALILAAVGVGAAVEWETELIFFAPQVGNGPGAQIPIIILDLEPGDPVPPNCGAILRSTDDPSMGLLILPQWIANLL